MFFVLFVGFLNEKPTGSVLQEIAEGFLCADNSEIALRKNLEKRPQSQALTCLLKWERGNKKTVLLLLLLLLFYIFHRWLFICLCKHYSFVYLFLSFCSYDFFLMNMSRLRCEFQRPFLHPFWHIFCLLFLFCKYWTNMEGKMCRENLLVIYFHLIIQLLILILGNNRITKLYNCTTI